jgi:DNA adenine methylase
MGFFRYMGGKHRIAPWIVQHLPPHRTYVEVFGGSAAVLFAKPPSEVEVYNDIDEAVVALFRVVRSPVLFDRFVQELEATLYSRAEFEAAKEILARPRANLLRRALAAYIVLNQGFAGKPRRSSWCYSHNFHMPFAWERRLPGLARIHRRLRRVYIERSDWMDILQRWDMPGTCFYLDPPYHPETRDRDMYRHEFSQADHQRLVERLLAGIKGVAVLSGYPNPTYEALERAGWVRYQRVTRQFANPLSPRPDPTRIEVLWVGPPENLRRCSTGLLGMVV